MCVEDLELVARVLVEADLADPEHALAREELRDELDDLAREDRVLRLLRIDAEPGVVADAVLRRPLRLEVGELAEVVVEALRTRAVVPRPERRLRDRHAPRQRHALVVVGRAAHHVDMGVDVHQKAPFLERTTLNACPPERRSGEARLERSNCGSMYISDRPSRAGRPRPSRPSSAPSRSVPASGR